MSMDTGIRRRLDALIMICSVLLGIVLTYLFFSDRTIRMFLLFALFPTIIVASVALWYSSGGSTDSGGR